MLDSLITPMEPQSFPHAFDSAGHIFQVKWDGVRVLAFVDHRGVRLQNRRLRDRTLQYPEMQDLPRQMKARDAIFDGEMIALDGGKPSFSRILERDLVTKPGQIRAALHIPVHYMIFDLLYYDGQDLTTLPWGERDEKLRQVLIPSEAIMTTESLSRDGKTFYRAIQEQGLEGMVAKDVTSPYLTGEKTAHWLKIKPRKDMICVVGGYILDGNGLKSLLAGAYEKGRLRYLGRVSNGLSGQELMILARHFSLITVDESPFSPSPPRQKGWFWLKPALTVKVEYLELTPDRQLRQPVIKGFTRTAPQECVLGEE